MARSLFTPEYFKIKKLNKKTNIWSYVKNCKIPLTFNQLMKFEGPVDTIFIFNENSIEVPCLLSFCHYFKIKIFILNHEDINEIKSEIKHAQMICIPSDNLALKEIEQTIMEQDIEQTFYKISLD